MRNFLILTLALTVATHAEEPRSSDEIRAEKEAQKRDMERDRERRAFRDLLDAIEHAKASGG